ncbi:hypothetical protein INR49_001206 [Caranx melampygus]|nr:hypothetical protein INR49_001206 [Caranx melampygus]
MEKSLPIVTDSDDECLQNVYMYNHSSAARLHALDRRGPERTNRPGDISTRRTFNQSEQTSTGWQGKVKKENGFDYKTLCVYGEKGMTIEEALKRDGRFINDLGKFSLSDNENPNVCTVCTQRVDSLDQKSFKICLPLNRRKHDEKQQENKDASNNVQSRQKTKSVTDVVKQSGVTVERAVKTLSADNIEKIYGILREQFQI